MPSSPDIAALEDRLGRLERQRQRLARTVMALSVVMLVLIVIAGMYLVQRSSARTYYNGQLRNLACLAVKRAPSSVSPTIRDLRNNYDCPPYQAPTTKPNGRPVKPAPRGARTVPTAAPSASQRSTLARPGRTHVRIVTRTPGSTTAAPDPTPTPSRTPRPSPTPTSIGLLNPVCGLVHLPVLCQQESP